MRKPALAVLLVASGTAAADDREPPVQLELGLNTRHFSPSTITDDATARRTTTAPETGTPGGNGVTVAIRFTKWTRWNTYLGVEAETGALTLPGSNIAAGYGIAGYRGEVGRFALSVELAPGKRWVRYGIQDATHEAWLVETRARIETFVSPRFTLGGAAGATFTGDVHAWMAGFYVGVHSLDYGKL